MSHKILSVKARNGIISANYRESERRVGGYESQCITELSPILYQKSRLHWEELLHPHRVSRIPIRKE